MTIILPLNGTVKSIIGLHNNVNMFMIVISSKNHIMSIGFDAEVPLRHSGQPIVFKDYTGNAH